MTEVVMAIDSLDVVPRRTLPPGFRLRPYRPGDDATWTRIHEDTGFYDPLPVNLFRHEFGTDEAALVARQRFVVDSTGQEVATATAWFNHPAHGMPGGRIHWVAVVPSSQGQGVAKALLGALCDRFAELGETAAYLTTDSHNARAIALYQNLGFRIVSGEPD